MYTPDRPLFGAPQPLCMHSSLYPREDGYVDLILTVYPYLSCEPLERSTYARLTLEEACDVWSAQAALLTPEESPS